MGRRTTSLYLCLFCTAVAILRPAVFADDPYRYFTWTVTYGTASPLGVPQQVLSLTFLFFDFIELADGYSC